jgi:hypothetical protein
MRSINLVTTLIVFSFAVLSVLGVLVRAEALGWTVKVDTCSPIRSSQLLSITKRNLLVSPASQREILHEKKDGQRVSVWSTSGLTHAIDIPLAHRRCKGTPNT